MTGPLVASGAIILDEAGGVLVVGPTCKDTWEILGGRMEPGEAPRDACARELQALVARGRYAAVPGVRRSHRVGRHPW